MTDWKFFTGQDDTLKRNPLEPIAARPAWRQFMSKQAFEETPDQGRDSWQEASKKRWATLREEGRIDARSRERGESFRIRQGQDGQSEILTAVNSALALRRPLLVTGNPGSGKTSLAYAIAYELALGPVLVWPITTRATLSNALYRYDAIARLQDTQLDKSKLDLDIAIAQTEAQKQAIIEKIGQGRSLGDYIQLGPVGTAFLPSDLPRVLLIDEIDKCDLNLPNDLLNLFEEGSYEIPELVRQKSDAPVEVQTEDIKLPTKVVGGRVTCYEFPLVIMTSNRERDFPPAFLRRCLRIDMPDPTDFEVLDRIVGAHFKPNPNQPQNPNWAEVQAVISTEIGKFADILKNNKSSLATDQLLNLVYMVRQSGFTAEELKNVEKEAELKELKKILLKYLTGGS